MRFNVCYGRLVSITDTSEKVEGIETLHELNEIVSEMLGCEIEIIMHNDGTFEVIHDDSVAWAVDTRYKHILITTESNKFVRSEGTENRLEAVCEVEVYLSEKEIELLKQGKDEEVLDNYRANDDWEWIYIIDEENGIGIIGKYANEVCISYKE